MIVSWALELFVAGHGNALLNVLLRWQEMIYACNIKVQGLEGFTVRFVMLCEVLGLRIID